MDRCHQTLDVYTDAGSACNHFVHLGKVGAGVGITVTQTATVHSGVTAVENVFIPADPAAWGGWYFQNGVLTGTLTLPDSNWGELPYAGLILTGATTLSFWARGALGGEKVEFFALGVGRNADTGLAIAPYPDSSPKVTACGIVGQPGTSAACYTTLTADWRPYTITLAGADLSYVLGGFGWVTNAPRNNHQAITFYLDDIGYNLARPDAPRFLVSYETISSTLPFDAQFRNTAFTYDIALALIAFTALGETARAQKLADAFVYAQAHDRFYSDGRLRNAYQGGDLALPPGWTPNDRAGTVRMPGWWDEPPRHWMEEADSAGSGAGNLAWAVIALLNFYAAYGRDLPGGQHYLDAAVALGNWIEANTHDTRGAGGYTGGYTGWEPNPTKLGWKSTEHNLDLYVAFERLYEITGEAQWHARALHARTFVEAMWNNAGGYYQTGTLTDGVALNPDVIPLDVQAWSLLAFGSTDQTRRAFSYAEANHRVDQLGFAGFDFDTDRDGIWTEGTAQMTAGYAGLLDYPNTRRYQAALQAIQASAANGDGRGLVAALADGLTT